MAVVAAVSGRSAPFLASRLDLSFNRSPCVPSVCTGWRRRSRTGRSSSRAGVSAWRPVIETLSDQLLAAVPSGVRVEDKGYGITAHWRSLQASGAELEAVAARATEVVETLGAENGLLCWPGKSSVELALPLGIDKGSVVTELCEGLESAAYLGDDNGDLLAFRALDQLRANTGLRTVKIAVSGAEAPSELLAEADLVLDGPSGAASFLEALARRVVPESSS